MADEFDGSLARRDSDRLTQEPILRVYGHSSQLPEETLRDAIQLGSERTFEQDPKYAIRLLVDIAIKALSPAINDPTTAVQALDEIEDLLIRLGRRRLEIGAFRDRQGELRVSASFPTWEDFLVLAFDEIRFYGSTSIQVMRRMRALLSELLLIMPEDGSLPSVTGGSGFSPRLLAHFATMRISWTHRRKTGRDLAVPGGAHKLGKYQHAGLPSPRRAITWLTVPAAQPSLAVVIRCD